ARTGEGDRHAYRGGRGGGAAEAGQPALRHRRAAYGRYERGRRSVRRRQDVPAASREERPGDEEGRGLPPPLAGGGQGAGRTPAGRIAPHYGKPVIHVLDASRAVGVVGSLINPGLKPEFVSQNSVLQEDLRQQFAARQDRRPLLPLAEARARRLQTDWSTMEI